MERVELLAPAKDLECGIAAINCGADAVYVGAARFGAREAAGNSLETIAELTRYAHRYWAKVYVTVNTLLYDEELPQAERLAYQLYEAGVDALIVQDMGLLECDLPPLPLFASTQMHNHTPERVEFLEQVGFSRAILARELTLDQIREIRSRTKLELECFIHGALCVSYSGQCYLSYALGGRSGNRGQCAQPCRRPYRLVDRMGNTLPVGRYPLSLHDLNLGDHLPELLATGVQSFKIEGRLKDKAYVMNVVGFYRQKLDELLEKSPLRASASGRCYLDFTPDPLKTFNRGYSAYFLHGRGAEVASTQTPKSTGEPLGKVTALQRNSFTLASQATLVPGDGLCFFDAQQELCGVTVNEVRGQSIFPARMDGLAVGTFIYRNHDHAFLAQMKRSRAERRIGISLRLQTAPEGLRLSALDEDGNQADITLACTTESAERPEQALANLEKQLRKLGGSGFECTGLAVDLAEVPFVPLAVLNSLRRGVLEQLELIREQNRPRLTPGRYNPQAQFPETELSFRGNVLNQKAAAFYRRHGVTSIEPAAEAGLGRQGQDMHGRPVMTTRYCLKYQLQCCPRERSAGHLLEPLSLVDEQGQVLNLHFDCARCVMEVWA